MAHSPIVIRLLRCALAVLVIPALLAGCIPIQRGGASEGGTVSPPQAAAESEAVAEPDSVESYLVDAIAMDYGIHPDELRRHSWEFGQEMMWDINRQDELARICNSPVYYESGETNHFSVLYEHYRKDVFWTVQVNFAETAAGPADGEPLSPFIGCLLLYWRLDDLGEYKPSAGKFGVDGEMRGVPFLCYRVGVLSGGVISTQALTQTTSMVHGDVKENWTQWPTTFADQAYLWCPLDIAAAMRSYVFGEAGSKPYAYDFSDEVGTINEEFQSEIEEHVFGQEATDAIEAIAGENGQLSVYDVIEVYDNFLSVVAIRTLVDGLDLYPLLDYLEYGCPINLQCIGYRAWMERDLNAVNSASQDLTLFGAFTRSAVPLEIVALNEICQGVTLGEDDQPTYKILDGGRILGTGRFDEGETGITPNGEVLQVPGWALENGFGFFKRLRLRHNGIDECEKLDLLPSEGQNQVPIWVGASSLFIGHRPGTEHFFEGTLDYIWFDPDQSVGG